MSYNFCKAKLLATCKVVNRSYPSRYLSKFSAATILTEDNIKRVIECIQKSAPIQMRWGKSDAEAAVLVPICVSADGSLSLLYTKRSGKLSRHVRQVSFPGGIKDSTDASYEDCALRETEEEIGLARSRIKLCGTGSLLRPPRTASIMPVFGIVENFSISELKLNHEEVEDAFLLPISELASEKNRRHTQFRGEYSAPVFLVDNYKIWGITGAITHNFLACLLPDSYKRKIPYVKLLKTV